MKLRDRDKRQMRGRERDRGRESTCKKYPEVDGRLQHPDHADQDHKGQHAKGSVRIGIDVRMPE